MLIQASNIWELGWVLQELDALLDMIDKAFLALVALVDIVLELANVRDGAAGITNG